MADSPTIITVSLNPTVDRLLEVERLDPGDHQTGREISRTPGGKGVNVSRVLAAIGIGSIATGYLGRANRDEFAALLDHPLVKDEFIMLAGRTRENVTIADRSTGEDTHIRDTGLEVTPAMIGNLGDKLQSLVKQGMIVVFSGSLPPGITTEDFANLIDLCNEAGARVAVDTSGAALGAVAGKKIWLLKPNTHELAELVGCELETLDMQVAAAKKLSSDVEFVLLSLGEDGAYLFTAGQIMHARPSKKIEGVCNTVGCGDVLLAVFLAGVTQGKELSTVLPKAVAAASASACHPIVAEFRTSLAEKIAGHVQVKII